MVKVKAKKKSDYNNRLGEKKKRTLLKFPLAAAVLVKSIAIHMTP